MATVDTDVKMAALEEKAVKYAIAVEARESIHRYLAYWSALFAAVVAIAGWYGWSVNSMTERIDAATQQQQDRLLALQRTTTELASNIAKQQTELNDRFATLRATSLSLDEKTQRVYSEAHTLAKTAAEFSQSGSAGLDRLNERLNNAAAAVARAEAARNDLERQVKAATALVEVSQRSVEAISGTAQRAKEFDHDIETHRSVFRNALLDHITLKSKKESPKLELAAADGKHKYVIWFKTPQIERHPFDVTYKVVVRLNSVPPDFPVDESKERVMTGVGTILPKERKWNVMDFANGEYQFAGDFVFNSRFARDFVTIRVAATEKLLQRFKTSVPAESPATPPVQQTVDSSG